MKYKIISAFLLLSSFSAYQLAKYFYNEENKLIRIERNETVTLYDVDSFSKYKVNYTTISKDSLIPYLPLLINKNTKKNDTITSPTNQTIIINSIRLIYLERKQ